MRELPQLLGTRGFWQAGRKGTGFLRAEDLNDLQSEEEEEEENAEKAEKKACVYRFCVLSCDCSLAFSCNLVDLVVLVVFRCRKL